MRTEVSLTGSPTDRRRLTAMINNRNAPQKHVWRAEIVLFSADCTGTVGIMRRTRQSKSCVWRWQVRVAEAGVDGPLRDVVGLCVDPPAHAIVLSLDEQSQIQALDRTRPGLPIKKGRLGAMTYDDKRQRTATLFAAPDVLDGAVICRNIARHRRQEFIRFLKATNPEVPPEKAAHVILDNDADHQTPHWTAWSLNAAQKHPKVRACLDRLPRFTFHFTPTPTSWPNAVDGFFAKLAKRRLVPFLRRPQGRHQPIPRRARHPAQALQRDHRPKTHPRHSKTWAPSVEFQPRDHVEPS